jgi:amino acid adenylation domain-containing protein
MSKQQVTGREAETVRDVVDQMAERQADKTFLLSPDTKHELTFKEFRQRVTTLSHRLLGLGLAKGDKVAFLLDNGLFSVELLFGAMYGGFVPVPVNVIAGASQVAYVLHHSDARVVFVSDEYQPLLSSIVEQGERPLQIIPAHPDFGPDWYQPDTIATTPPLVDGEDDALLVYTSGSTGLSKGVFFSHRGILLNGLNTGSVYHLSPQDRSLCVLPLYHMNAIVTTLYSTLLSGGSVVIPHQFSVAYFWEWVADYRCTWFALVPTILSHLVNWTDPYSEGKAERLCQIRFVRSSSAPLAPTLHRAFEEKFPLLLVEGMGMTEASVVFMNPPSFTQRRIGSPGLPCHETKIVDAHGRTLSPGQTGEILLRGPGLMKGYYKNPEAMAEVRSPDGWLRTGDLGYQDKDGYFFIVGRAKEIVIKGGENIAPREIDETLLRHAAVLEAAAVGVPDSYLGEDIVAYVVLKPGSQCAEQELLNHCAQTLGEFKTPSRVYFVEDLPKGPSGKVQRLKLLERNSTPATAQHTTTAQLVQPNHSDQRLSGFVSPRTPVEEKLAAIWESVLQRTPIGIDDNFFSLGGHSLLAAGILARVRDTFQVSLPLRALFEAPTVAALAEHIEATRHADDRMYPPSVQSLPLDRVIPLSFAQQRLWFLEQFNPHSATYNIPFAFRLSGPLDLTALQQAMNAMVTRHESLRTTFSSRDGDPQQIIADQLPLSIAVVALSSWPEALREAEALRLATEEVQRPFDLTHGPLLRTLVVQLGANDHLLVITWHHIIVDGWSLGVFTRELRVLYEAYCNGRAPVLPALPLQYADFAVWQRQWMQGESIAKQISYWKAKLAGAPASLPLPTDHPRPAQQTYHGSRLTFLIPPSLTAELQCLSQQEGATLYMILLAAFQVLLSRYTGEEDIAVGSPIAGRVRPELEGLIGFFLNTLVMRTAVSHNLTFRAALHCVRDTALDAYAHQDVPFEQLVEELHVPRVLEYSPVVQVFFALQNVPQYSLELPGIISERVAVTSGTTKFDLSLLVWNDEHGLRGEVEYNTDLFERPTITRLVGHYQTLLEGIVANPDQLIATLPLLTPPERHQLLVEWNTTQTTYPRDLCIHQLFAAQVEQTPEAIAVVYEDHHLTYRELNARANQLAHYLKRLGVGPETLVGICVERSLEMIIGLLGILKAGGAYVPLDPSYPKERLEFILEDTKVPVLLTQRRLVESFPKYNGKIFCIDNDWGEICQESEENLSVQSSGENLAYVIYTSGSTGKPKGVAIEHQSVVAFLSWAHTVFTADEMASVLASTSICFDLSIFELFAPLSRGGRVVVVKDALALMTLPVGSQITLINTVPSAIADLLRMNRIPSSVSTINLAGEPLKRSLVKEIYERTTATKVYDLYGPSEDTTYSTYTLRMGEGLQTIGRPISNTRIYILDSRLQPVPIGVPGELYIGGAGLARGYLNRPELTAEKFIPNPFSTGLGARLYKTGDRARYLPDGNIEFLGRVDNQVKVRGFRIELGEIERVLRQHPAVRDTVVALREDTPGDKRLVAYLVPRQSYPPTVSELRGFLQRKLPDYMTPSTFVFLDTLPLTPNGKVDRQALPPPEPTRPDSEQAWVAPRTPEEEILAGIWAQILGIDRVGMHDNFFELGGHSLKATQIVSRVRAAFEIELPLRALFEAPTVAGLAAYIVHRQEQQPGQTELAQIVAEVQGLSEEEVRQMLSQVRPETGR